MRALLTFLSVFCLAVMLQAQKTYVTSMTFTFSGGNDMPALGIGNDCGNKDVDPQVNSIDGVLNVNVNKVCHTWSYMEHWMGGAYAPSLVFQNRYIEMRIKSTVAHDTGLAVSFQPTSGCIDNCKTIPAMKYTINEADKWEIKLFNLGGNADTIWKEIDYFFPNGSYTIDYVLYGDAAVPPIPTINQVKTQMMKTSWVTHTINLTGIGIPGRLAQGLTIDAKPTPGCDFFDTVYFDPIVDPLPSELNLNYIISPNTLKSSDSITVTLRDTIRNTSKSMTFLVFMGNFGSTSLAEETSDVKVYPTIVTNKTNIEFSSANDALIQIMDMTGSIITIQEVHNSNLETLDMTAYAKGLYLINIVRGNSLITKKIVKID